MRHVTVGRLVINAWCVCGNEGVEINIPVEMAAITPKKLRALLISAAYAIDEGLEDKSIPFKKFCGNIRKRGGPGTSGELTFLANRKKIVNGKAIVAYPESQ